MAVSAGPDAHVHSDHDALPGLPSATTGSVPADPAAHVILRALSGLLTVRHLQELLLEPRGI